MTNSVPPEDPTPPTATETVEILQQVISQNQYFMRLLFTNSGKICRNNNTITPTPSTGPHKGQTHKPTPAYLQKYYWTHGHGNLKVFN